MRRHELGQGAGTYPGSDGRALAIARTPGPGQEGTAASNSFRVNLSATTCSTTPVCKKQDDGLASYPQARCHVTVDFNDVPEGGPASERTNSSRCEGAVATQILGYPVSQKTLNTFNRADLDEENLVEHTQFGVFPNYRQSAVDDGVALTSVVAIDDYYKSPFILVILRVLLLDSLDDHPRKLKMVVGVLDLEDHLGGDTGSGQFLRFSWLRVADFQHGPGVADQGTSYLVFLLWQRLHDFIQVCFVDTCIPVLLLVAQFDGVCAGQLLVTDDGENGQMLFARYLSERNFCLT